MVDLSEIEMKYKKNSHETSYIYSKSGKNIFQKKIFLDLIGLYCLGATIEMQGTTTHQNHEGTEQQRRQQRTVVCGRNCLYLSLVGLV